MIIRLGYITFLTLFSTLAVAKEASIVEDPRGKIVVIDTTIDLVQVSKPYMCANGSHSMTSEPGWVSETKSDFFLHGRNVVGLIGELINTEKYCIYHIAFTTPGFGKKDDGYWRALKELKNLKHVVGLNLSISSNSNDPRNYSEPEFEALEALSAKGAKVVVAAGNMSLMLRKDNCYVFPACYKLRVSHPENFHIVGSPAMIRDLRYRSFSNFTNEFEMDYEDGVDQGDPPFSGTSQATAIRTGKLFRESGIWK